jgi:hypothetical protein
MSLLEQVNNSQNASHIERQSLKENIGLESPISFADLLQESNCAIDFKSDATETVSFTLSKEFMKNSKNDEPEKGDKEAADDEADIFPSISLSNIMITADHKQQQNSINNINNKNNNDDNNNDDNDSNDNSHEYESLTQTQTEEHDNENENENMHNIDNINMNNENEIQNICLTLSKCKTDFSMSSTNSIHSNTSLPCSNSNSDSEIVLSSSNTNTNTNTNTNSNKNLMQLSNIDEQLLSTTISSFTNNLRESLLQQFGTARERHYRQSQNEMNSVSRVLQGNIHKKDKDIQRLTSELKSTQNKLSKIHCSYEILKAENTETHKKLISVRKLSSTVMKWKNDCDKKRFITQYIYQTIIPYKKYIRLHKIFFFWKTKSFTLIHRRYDAVWQQRLEVLSHKIINEYEIALQNLRTELECNQSELQSMKNEREQQEQNLKRAFMRGVSALNLEAMSLFAQAHDAEQKDDNQNQNLTLRSLSLSNDITNMNKNSIMNDDNLLSKSVQHPLHLLKQKQLSSISPPNFMMIPKNVAKNEPIMNNNNVNLMDLEKHFDLSLPRSGVPVKQL